MTEGVYHDGLQCWVLGLTYDFASRTGRLNMEEGACCDMTGCIRLFEAIDPRVLVVQTFSGEKQDTEFRHSKTGIAWWAVPHDEVMQE